MKRFLEKALQNQPEHGPFGAFIKQNWANTHEAGVKIGTLKGSESPNVSYTEQFIAACNDFDRNAVVAQAKAMPQ